MRSVLPMVLALALVSGACDGEAAADGGVGGGMDAAREVDAARPPAGDGSVRLPDAARPPDAAADGATPSVDASTGADGGGSVAGALTSDRDRLLATLDADRCGLWASFDESQRLVFLTLTHRLHVSTLADGSTMLSHLTRLYAVLGGGADGSSCGGIENNRLFLAMDTVLWQAMVDTWNDTPTLGDGGGLQWIRTRDLAGPHDPFDASDETDSGLRCAAFVIETSDSRPPTAQGHFFLEGSAVPVERGPISLPSDPLMFEIDHDFDCLHRSNPTCDDFVDRYLTHYGDFERTWAPTACGG